MFILSQFTNSIFVFSSANPPHHGRENEPCDTCTETESILSSRRGKKKLMVLRFVV